jgi:hypothetical protein
MSGRSDFIEHGGHTSCHFPAKWQEVEDDRKAVREALARIELKLADIDDKVDHHHKRMFIDNGSPSIQTRLTQGIARFDEHARRIQQLEDHPAVILKWAVGIVGMLTAAGSFVVWAVGHVKFGG